jgi:RNA polymerase sigma-70 factor (ECF subfamily)
METPPIFREQTLVIAIEETGKATASVAPTSDCSGDAVLQNLISRIAQQDQRALTELYRALIGRVYSVALRVVRDPPTAEEVAEDTFWQIWRQATRFDADRGTALSWIMTVARSRALDALRARERAMANTVLVDTRAAALEVESVVEGTITLDSAEDFDGARTRDPRELVSALQESHLLQKSLSRLEPTSRQLVDLAFFAGLTHDEIVTQTGIPLGTVKSRIRRALSSLRSYLAPLGSADCEPVSGGLPMT